MKKSAVEVRLPETLSLFEMMPQLTGLLDGLQDEVFLCDTAGNVVWVNHECARRYNVEFEQLLGRSAEDFRKCGILPPLVAEGIGKELKRRTVIMETPDGRRLVVSGSPLTDRTGAAVGVIVTARETTELDRLQQRLEQANGLTKRFREELEELRQRRLIAEQSIVATSAPMRAILALSQKVARVDSTVLITGESGVGKEVIARLIHKESPRRRAPFIKINCGGIPESLLESELFGYEKGAFTGARREGKVGLIETAQGGTLFLDEVAEIPLHLQVKLLQVLQEHKLIRIGGTRAVDLDLRIIAATNKDLREMVARGAFREDLFYRLNVVPIHIPPLRERRDEIVPLVNHFLNLFCSKYSVHVSISPEALEVLRSYRWPGNIRELQNLMENLVVTASSALIRPEHLPSHVLSESCDDAPPVVVNRLVPLREALEMVEKEMVRRAVERYGSSSAVGRALGIDQSTAFRKIRKYLGDTSSR